MTKNPSTHKAKAKAKELRTAYVYILEFTATSYLSKITIN